MFQTVPLLIEIVKYKLPFSHIGFHHSARGGDLQGPVHSGPQFQRGAHLLPPRDPRDRHLQAVQGVEQGLQNLLLPRGLQPDLLLPILSGKTIKRLFRSQRLMSRWKYQFSYDH